MARKAKTKRQVYIPTVPQRTCWIESDSYDRRAWGDICADAPPIADLVAAGESLVPHFASLLEDLFLGLFKYNVLFLKPDQVRQSAALNKAVLESMVPSPAFEALKSRTLLEEDKAAIAAIALGEQVLETVKQERLINRREMLDLWDLQHQEEDLEEKAAALKSTVEMAEQSQDQDTETKKKI